MMFFRTLTSSSTQFSRSFFPSWGLGGNASIWTKNNLITSLGASERYQDIHSIHYFAQTLYILFLRNCNLQYDGLCTENWSEGGHKHKLFFSFPFPFLYLLPSCKLLIDEGNSLATKVLNSNGQDNHPFWEMHVGFRISILPKQGEKVEPILKLVATQCFGSQLPAIKNLSSVQYVYVYLVSETVLRNAFEESWGRSGILVFHGAKARPVKQACIWACKDKVRCFSFNWKNLLVARIVPVTGLRWTDFFVS